MLPRAPIGPARKARGKGILDLFRVLWKRKWLIVLVTFLGTSAAGAYALLATPIYRAQAV